MTESTTERTKFHFVVKEFFDGTPWIMFEPYKKGLSQIGDGFLGFDLKGGTDYNKAQEIAAYLNKHIDRVEMTTEN